MSPRKTVPRSSSAVQSRAAASERGLKAASDRLILDVAEELTGPEVLVVLLHGTTLASALRSARPDLRFTFFTPEHFFSRTLHSFNADGDVPGAAQCRIICAADPPQDAWDSIVFPTFTTDSSEAAQELFQALQTRLRPGGRLFVSTNNPRDRWIQSQLRPLFSPVEVRKLPRGVLCIAVRSAPLKKLRGFYARFGFRCHDQVLLCETRPGVFSHRRLDGGARALIRSLDLVQAEIAAGSLESPCRIVEMGSGSGAVSVAAASTFPTADVLAIDSDARAIECTQRSAALNQLTNIRTLLSSEGVGGELGTWDLLLGNPPYYSDFRIAELFLQTARKLLRPGGRVHIVSKPVEWQLARMQQLFADVQQHTFGEYFVFTAVRTAGKAPGKHGT
ncbi:MAG: class I SAM-dependent methyltransferase [Planctomycetaceae bacterium]